MVTTPNSIRTTGHVLSPIQYYKADGSSNGQSATSTYQTIEKRYSMGHPIPRNGAKWTGDVGGPFFHQVQVVNDAPMHVSVTVPSGINHGQKMVGDLHLFNGTGIAAKLGGVNLTEPSKASLDAAGTTAIAQCNPDNPSFGLASFLGELHEGIPKLCGSDFFKGRASSMKNAGSEYLNVEFGWKPFKSDLTKAAQSVIHSHKVIHEYQHQSGQLIHRRFSFPATVSTSSSTQANFSPSGPGSIPSQFAGPNRGTLSTDHSVEVRKWFSGAFTVYLDPGKSQLGKLERHYQEAQHLLGVSLTPDVVWELTPWSWLADWYTNIGDIMTNVRAFMFDGMVMPYGYVMQETVTRDTYACSYSNAFVDGSGYSGSMEVVSKVQNRVPANPFGFGLTKANLSPRQLAILAALGIILLA